MTKQLPLILLALAGAASAETIIQPVTLSTSNEGSLYNGSGNEALAISGFFTATFQPFNTALGKLNSFNLKVEIAGELAGSFDENGGVASGGMGGTFLLNGEPFDGTGTSNGTGGPPNGDLEVDFAIPSYNRDFIIVPEGQPPVGQPFNPALGNTVQGPTPFTISYNSAVNVSFTNVVNLAASVEGTFTMTYNYETPAGLEALRIVNLVRDGVQQTVLIEWTSATGRTYAVDASNTVGGWQQIQGAIPADVDGITSHTEENIPATATRRFYRVREED